MNLAYTIKKAVLSEKTYKQMEKGVYTFWIDPRSTKSQVAEAVEKQFGIKVAKVNLASAAPKTKKISRTRKTVKTQGGRKAIVYLAQGAEIEMLLPKTEGEKKKTKKGQKKELSKDQSLKEEKEVK